MSTNEVSVVDLIKQDMQDLANNKEVFIPVPGFDESQLQIKFRAAVPGEINELNTKIEKTTRNASEWDKNLLSAMDTIIKLCEGFYVQPGELEKPVVFDPNGDGIPVQFDDRLCGVLGLEEGTTARNILKKLFDNNELRILNFSEKLSRWLVNSKADLSKEIWQLGG